MNKHEKNVRPFRKGWKLLIFLYAEGYIGIGESRPSSLRKIELGLENINLKLLGAHEAIKIKRILQKNLGDFEKLGKSYQPEK